MPQVPVEIDDPFAELSAEQLTNVAQVARIRRLLEEELIPADGQSAKDVKRYTAELSSQGIDVDWLLSQRERVTRERMQRSEQVDEELSGSRIRIPGYILTLASRQRPQDHGVPAGSLGRSLHSQPPSASPNQMIHVSVPGGAEPRGQFSPVWIEGIIELKPASYDLFLVDGSMQVKVAYTMVTNAISECSQPIRTPLPRWRCRRTPSRATAGFRPSRAKASLIFTKAMSEDSAMMGARKRSGSRSWSHLATARSHLGTRARQGGGDLLLVGDGGSFRRGIAMGVIIAITHVLSSIIVVLVMDFAVRQATGQAPSDYRAIRLGSYALIIVIGAVMLRNAIQALRQSRKTAHSHAGHDHHHEHHDCLACARLRDKKKGAGTWLALAVGVVPCTGALLVLLFGVANDLLFPASPDGRRDFHWNGHRDVRHRCLAIARQAHGLPPDAGRSGQARPLHLGLRIAGAAVVLLIGTFLFGLAAPSGQISLPVVSSKLGETPPRPPDSYRIPQTF